MAPAGPPLIVGSGIAGLYVALRLQEAGRRPLVITKSGLDESNTRYAQGGIAAAVGPDDSPARHLRDTVRAGDGLVDRRAARLLTEEGPSRVADLVRLGVPFDTVEGQIALGREAAHSRSRILHAGGDATGYSIEMALKARVGEAGIDVRERTILRRLAAGPGRTMRATVARDDGSALEELDPRPVVVATGGAGSLYRESSNPAIATGEGVAIAFRAGAILRDMEFVQFHPTVFARPGAPRHLLTEALRGEGAVLRNAAGERFLAAFHPDAELAPRDVVSRAIVTELERAHTDHVFLDATGIPRDRLYARFPTVCRFLAGQGLDPARDPIPVAPMAHFMIGGIATDVLGRGSLPGLFACGEVASTGVHGANRLASNSLLEGLVFGERVARTLASDVPGGPRRSRRRLTLAWPAGGGAADSPELLPSIRDRLWTSVGIVRDGLRLALAAREFETIGARTEPPDDERPAGPTANAALTAALIARAALARTESRGAHFRSDFPTPRPEWRVHLDLVRAPDRGAPPPNG
ncbi:MAG TPA: L-aspartate oxidase [Thermoplasmata archaeon]|nr:L-aspartate oxidase [Thermoplasmata archaeon]